MEMVELNAEGKRLVANYLDVLVESGAIVEYILRKYGNGRLRPAESSKLFLTYEFWMYYAESSIMMLLVFMLVFKSLPAQSPFFIRPLVRAISKAVHDKFIDPQLKV